ALCVLPFFTFDAVWGLFAGCLIANTLTGGMPADIIFGSLATLFAALCSYAIKRSNFAKSNETLAKWLVPLPAIVINAFVVGWLLKYVYSLPVSYESACLYVAAGQAIACYGVGMPLLTLLDRPSIKRIISE
ncbi:MAG: QueT transporter family protein, partial [Clostridiales bacterium]|nr:QueT transporter family protein [Clostridiales bacterium]